MEIFSIKNLVFMDMIHYPDVAVKQGATVFVRGESGSGKSTLFKMLNGVEQPSAGQILFKGQDIAEMDTVQLRRQVLLVSQSVYLFDATIEGNFKEFATYREKDPPGADTMNRLLTMCGIDFPLNTPVETMSGGERQRVYLAIYLSFCPCVLMLDEPTSALDAQRAQQVMGNLKAHCTENGITMMVISHDGTLASRFADQIISLEGGAKR